MRNADRHEKASDTAELAKRLAAGYLSWFLDISYQSAYKTYAQQGGLGNYWLGLAGAIMASPPGGGDGGAPSDGKVGNTSKRHACAKPARRAAAAGRTATK